MKIVGQLTITDCAYAMDGGSKYLMTIDEKGNEFHFSLPQHHIPANFGQESLPGRLYINEKPIDVRSELEEELLNKLVESKIDCSESEEEDYPLSTQRIIFGKDIQDYFSAIEKGSNFAIAYMVKEVIDFVKSDFYTELAKKMKER